MRPTHFWTFTLERTVVEVFHNANPDTAFPIRFLFLPRFLKCANSNFRWPGAEGVPSVGVSHVESGESSVNVHISKCTNITFTFSFEVNSSLRSQVAASCVSSGPGPTRSSFNSVERRGDFLNSP